MNIRSGLNGAVVTKHVEEGYKNVLGRPQDKHGMVESNAPRRTQTIKKLAMRTNVQV